MVDQERSHKLPWSTDPENSKYLSDPIIDVIATGIEHLGEKPPLPLSLLKGARRFNILQRLGVHSILILTIVRQLDFLKNLYR